MDNNTLHEVKISVSSLKKGMYVSRLDKDWSESSFMLQGFLIKNQKTIEKLQEECKEVYIDVVKGDDIDRKTSVPQTNKTTGAEKEAKKGLFDKWFGEKKLDEKISPINRENTYKLEDIVEQKVSTKSISPPVALLTFDKEMNVAKQTHAKTSQVMKDVMGQAKEGKKIDADIAKDTVKECMESILRSPDAMMLMTNLKTKNKTAWQQSMNAAVLSITFGRYLNLTDNELVILGLCGMLFDIGKLRISKEDLAQATAEEKKKLIQSHTTLGYEILSHSPGAMGKIVAEVARDHHERLDGKGFPNGLQGKEISAYTRMISIVDAYNTLTTDKPDKKGMTHYDAITMILDRVGSCFDETLVNSFNQCIGTYPVGSIVELNTGEIAMVVETNPKQKLRPKVILLTTPDKEKCSKQVVDLADNNATSSSDFYSIRGIVRAETYGITL